MSDYRGPHFGYFNRALDRVSFIYTAYIRTDILQNADGTNQEEFTTTKVQGSLQTFHKKETYSMDGSNFSSRDGRFFAKYDVNLYEGDLIKKNGSLYRITDMDDYDYHGVKSYSVIRLGMDESRRLMTRFEVESKTVVPFEDKKVSP